MIKKNKGFTLIELLVVIAILGILSAIVITSLSSSKNKTNATAVLANLRGVIPELVVCADEGKYANTAGGVPPTADGAPFFGSYICIESDGAIIASHTVIWPAMPTGSSWVYGASENGDVPLNNNTFTFKATIDDTPQAGEAQVKCSIATGSCELGLQP